MTAKEIKIQHNHTTDIVVIENERLQQENTNLKMQIDELIKKYDGKIIGIKTTGNTFYITDCEENNLIRGFIKDLSKLKEVKK